MRRVTDPVHFSTLKHIARSPAHYRAALADDTDSAARRFGRLVHYLTLGGDFAVYEGQRRGKAWDEFQAAHPGADIFTASEREAAEPAAESVLSHPLVRDLGLLRGETERPIGWEWLGRTCSSRLDVLGAAHITDLKTCPDAHPDRFTWHATKLHYHAQLAFYKMSAAYLGVPIDSCYIVAVESKAPYEVTVFRATPEALLDGEKRCRAWMERLLQCEATDEWPGYAQSVVPLDMPEPFELEDGGDDPDEEDAA